MSVVVVHRGARDHYQTALALSEAGLLDTLVTDLYWRADSGAARLAERFLPAGARSLLRARFHSELPPQQVRTLGATALASFAADKFSATPFAWRARATRATDARLGREAGLLARAHGSAVLSYSYYAHGAFAAAGSGARLLFQMHPHPESMRHILRAELARHPECAASLQSEWELGLSEAEFERLAEEPTLADFAFAASSFTRQTLIDHGFAPDRVFVVPYGVDLDRFRPAPANIGTLDRPLRILFTGTVSQRKGIKYLLEAVRALGTRQIELRIRGRAVDDLAIVRRLVPTADVRLSVSNAEMLDAYQTSDLFVFPSVAEGFGHVLIEAMASGLPVLSTTRTAAADLVTEGRDGFVVAPSRTDVIAERLEWALTHRAALAEMKAEARRKAETFTWDRFRAGVVSAVSQSLGAHRRPASTYTDRVAAHV